MGQGVPGRIPTELRAANARHIHFNNGPSPGQIGLFDAIARYFVEDDPGIRQIDPLAVVIMIVTYFV